MIVATALSITNPWWAAMAVWMVGQPTRGLLLERSAAQLAGTVSGGLAANAILILAAGHAAAALFGLSIWLAICCAVSNVLRHQRAYGAALCGLTTAVIVILTLDTATDPVGFATARVADNFIGIAASILLVVLWSPPPLGTTLIVRADAVAGLAIEVAACAFDGRPEAEAAALERKLLMDLAALEASAEDGAAGSVQFRRRLRPLRGLLASLLDVVAIARAMRQWCERAPLPQASAVAALAGSLRGFARALAANEPTSVRTLTEAVVTLAREAPALAPCLDDLQRAMSDAMADHRAMLLALPGETQGSSLGHPDWRGARLAALRGFLMAAIASAIWLLSGLDAVRYLVLGTCVFTTLFSAADEPALIVRRILIGGVVASLAALGWRAVVLPLVGDSFLSLALAVPLILIASVVQANRGTVFIGLAFNMLFAVLGQPVRIGQTDLSGMALVEAMLILGILLSDASYRWLLPMTTVRRRQDLRRSIPLEVRAISARAGTAWSARHLGRLRFLVLGLVARSGTNVEAADGALAALSVGHAMLRIGAMAPTDEAVGGIREILRTMSQPIAAPLAVANAMRDWAGRVADPTLLWSLESAANDITQHGAFFMATRPRPAAE